MAQAPLPGKTAGAAAAVAPVPEEQLTFPPLTLKLPDCWETSDEALAALGELNELWRFELTAKRELVFVQYEAADSSERGLEIMVSVGLWNRRQRGGHVYGPAVGVRFTSAGLRMPDVAWLSNERHARAFVGDSGLLHECPELIVEVLSPSQQLAELEENMEEWMANGARLGWLVDPFAQAVLVYRAGAAAAERLVRPAALSGEDVCAGLVVEMEWVWAVGADPAADMSAEGE